MFSIKTWRKFHIVVVKRRQRRVQKSVMHVQSSYYAYLNRYWLFCRSLCRCRRCRLTLLHLSLGLNYCSGMLTITQLVEASCTPAPGAFRYREHEKENQGTGFFFFPLSNFAPLPSIWTSRQTVSGKSTAHTQYLFNSQKLQVELHFQRSVDQGGVL